MVQNKRKTEKRLVRLSRCRRKREMSVDNRGKKQEKKKKQWTKGEDECLD